ncbi:MAG: hypothetical protein GY810_21495 [Aureispira sp.]|nr:hypothetical protein [Aureispira sp.]
MRLTCICMLLPMLCWGQRNNFFILESQFKDFIPITPIEYEVPISVVNDSFSGLDTLLMQELAQDKAKVLKFLSNEAVHVTVRHTDQSGQVTYGPGHLSAGRGSYTVIADYAKFTTLKVEDKDGGYSGFAKVGVGVRIRADIQTRRASLTIGDLLMLGISAKSNKLVGTLSVDIIGMESKEITALIPLQTEISPTTVQHTLQAMATIKSKIYDEKTRLYPQTIAIKREREGCSVSDILKGLEKEQQLYWRHRRKKNAVRASQPKPTVISKDKEVASSK